MRFKKKLAARPRLYKKAGTMRTNEMLIRLLDSFIV
jgi:hypothetical protein